MSRDAEKKKAYMKKWSKENYIANKVATLARCKAYASTDAGIKTQRKYSLKSNHGLTLEAYADMFENQKGRCAICDMEQCDKILCVDHDHDSGKIRGLLCSTCNSGIGMLKDDLYILQRAVQYLTERK